MNAVTAEYQALIESMSIKERVRRADALFRWSRDFLARQISDAEAALPEDDLKWEVALRQYGGDPAARELIKELRSRVAR